MVVSFSVRRSIALVCANAHAAFPDLMRSKEPDETDSLHWQERRGKHAFTHDVFPWLMFLAHRMVSRP